MHILNSRVHMCVVSADNSYSVISIGVGRKGMKTACSYTGRINNNVPRREPGHMA